MLLESSLCFSPTVAPSVLSGCAVQLTEMGFSEQACVAALSKCKNDENAAVEYLMSNS